MSQQSQQNVAKRYLLGILSEDERDRFEQQYFSDNALFDEVELMEDDLVDRYARGELTGDDRSLFDQALSKSTRLLERVEFARLLSKKTTPQRDAKVEPVPQPGFWQRLFAPQQQSVRLAFGFGVLLLVIGGSAVGVAWMNLRQQSAGLAARDAELNRRNEEANRRITELQARNEQRANDLQKQADDLEAERQSIKQQLESSDSLQNLVASLTLQPGITRSADTPSQEFTLNQKYATLNLKLELMDSGYPRYRAVILTPDLKPVSKPRTLTPKSTPSGKFLTLPVPLKGMSPGDYFVKLEGIDDAGKTEPVNEYRFRLNRPK